MKLRKKIITKKYKIRIKRLRTNKPILLAVLK